MPPINRLHSLDGLRGVAALFVAIYHFSANTVLTQSGFTQNGWLSVDLFFVISGVVLDRRYFANPDATFREFCTARLARMMPVFYIMLALFLLIDGAVYISSGLPAGDLVFPLAVNLVALQSFGLLDRLWFYGPSWSISAEIWINLLLFPLMLHKRSFWFLGAIILVGSVLFLTVLDIQTSYDFGWFRCLVGISIGICVSRLANDKSRANVLGERDLPWLQLLLSALWLGAFVAAFHFKPIFALSPLLFGLLGYLLIADWVPQIRRLFSVSAFVFLGKISFAVYMVHFFIGGRLMRAAVPVADRLLPFDLVLRTEAKKWNGLVLGVNEVQGIAFLLIYLGTTIIVAHFMLKWIEKPLYQSLKRRLRAEPKFA